MSNKAVCEWCQEEFDRPHERGPAPRFCSPSHRQRAHEFRRGYGVGIDAVSKAFSNFQFPDMTSINAALANVKLPDMTAINDALANVALPEMNGINEALANIKLPDMRAVDIALKNMTVPNVDVLNAALTNVKLPDITAINDALANVALPEMDLVSKAFANIKLPDMEALTASLSNLALPDVQSIYAQFADLKFPDVGELISNNLGNSMLLNLDLNFTTNFNNLLRSAYAEVGIADANNADTFGGESTVTDNAADQLVAAAVVALSGYYLSVKTSERLTPAAVYMLESGLQALNMALALLAQLGETTQGKGLIVLCALSPLLIPIKHLRTSTDS